MAQYPEYTIQLKPKPVNIFPKKILVKGKIPKDQFIPFDTTLALWVADTPESKYVPMITLTINTPYGKLAISVPKLISLQLLLNQIECFLIENESQVNRAWLEAILEWLQFHPEISKKNFPLSNDTTVITVQQEGQGEKILDNHREKIYILEEEQKNGMDKVSSMR